MIIRFLVSYFGNLGFVKKKIDFLNKRVSISNDYIMKETLTRGN
jgi:hypothetical protein